MKKSLTSSKKIVLRKESIRVLHSHTLTLVAGGGGGVVYTDMTVISEVVVRPPMGRAPRGFGTGCNG
jgi:hypothetical protein